MAAPALLTALALLGAVPGEGRPAANPLLGTWVGTRIAAPGAATMTVTADAIRFSVGGREIGVAPVASFRRDAALVSVRTRLGEVYRFRFTAGDRVCRVAARTPECFARAPDA